MADFKAKCTKFDFGWGSAPDPAGGAIQRSRTVLNFVTPAIGDVLSPFFAVCLCVCYERTGLSFCL